MRHPGAILRSLPAGAKLLALAALGACSFAVTAPLPLALALTILCALAIAAGLRPGTLVRQMIPVGVMLAGIFIVHWAAGDSRTGLATVLRALALVAAALVVTHTTRMPAMLESLQRALEPLRRLGIKPAGVAMMVALTIRFIPELLQTAGRIREAQRARGLGRNGLALVVPLLIRTLRNAELVAAALDARGFDPDAPLPPSTVAASATTCYARGTSRGNRR